MRTIPTSLNLKSSPLNLENRFSLIEAMRIKHPSNKSFYRPVGFSQQQEKCNDSVQFSSSTVHTYPLIPLEQVQVVRGNAQTPIQLREQELRFLLEKVQDANQMALAHQKVGNVSGDYFASAVGLEDGTWGVGTNIETSQQDRSCGERVSMLVAWNQSIQKHVAKNPDESYLPEHPLNPDGMKIKQIIMSKSQLGEHMVPCGECQGWMGTHRYFSPSTQIITLDKISPSPTSSKTWEPPQYKLWIRELQDLLPLWGKQQPSLTSQPIRSLPIHFSPKSLKLLKTQKVQEQMSPENIQKMLVKAENAYTRNVTNGFTGRKNGVAVMMSNQEIFHNGRFEWHKRMVEPGDMRAAANGIAKIKRRQERWDYLRSLSQHYLGKTLTQWLENRITTLNNNLEKILPTSFSKYVQAITFQGVAKIEAVAYYGEVAEEIPNIKSLGYFAKQNHGGPNTLVICIEKQNGKDAIQVRTIQDYMSEIYVSATDKPALPQD